MRESMPNHGLSAVNTGLLSLHFSRNESATSARRIVFFRRTCTKGRSEPSYRAGATVTAFSVPSVFLSAFLRIAFGDLRISGSSDSIAGPALTIADSEGIEGPRLLGPRTVTSIAPAAYLIT